MTNRRAFLSKGATALAAGTVLMFIKPSHACAAGDQVTSTISSNHGHAFGIGLADVVANGPASYSIQGASGHAHSIDLTEANLAALGRAESVTVQSVGGSHSHEVVLTVI